jgi:hypothetical protein
MVLEMEEERHQEDDRKKVKKSFDDFPHETYSQLFRFRSP